MNSAPMLPFQGSTTQTRHTSRTGAIAALPKYQSQLARMLDFYRIGWPLSDGNLAGYMGLPEARISARRAVLLKRGWLQFHDIVSGPHKAKVTRWMLTESGRAVAEQLADKC